MRHHPFTVATRATRPVLSLLLAAGAPAEPADTSGAPASDTAAGGGGALTIARPTETISPGNPVMSNIYQTLVKLDTDPAFQPDWPRVGSRWRRIASASSRARA